jgi:uncharacterized membrane protein
MHARRTTSGTGNIFLRMHPLQRLLLSFLSAVIVFFLIRKMDLALPFIATILWDVFAFVYILTCWIIFFTRPQEDIVKQANKDDGSRGVVLVSILIASFASMFTVLLLMISENGTKGNEIMSTIIAVSGMMLSWIMVHTIFTIHYAHMYYEKNAECIGPALDFPGDKKPDYIDFAYFSFVIGMTFQVSDVEIHSSKMRRTALAHALLAFALNTFVVALTINLIAGLRK